MLKSWFFEDISVEYEFKSEKFKGGGGGIVDLKLNNLESSGKTTKFKTLPTLPRSYRYLLIYIFAMESVKICRLYSGIPSRLFRPGFGLRHTRHFVRI